MAANHRRSANLLAANTVPARTDVCLRQALHWNNLRDPARHDAMRLAGAIGTFKTIRPAPFDKRRVALLLAAIRLVECAFAETFLKLHLVARHRCPPENSMFCFCSRKKPKLTQERIQEVR